MESERYIPPEALDPELALKEKISKMTLDETDARILEIEDRFREMDEIAADPKRLEKKYGANAWKKINEMHAELERERMMLRSKRPENVARQRILELHGEIAAAPEDKKEELGELQDAWRGILAELQNPPADLKEPAPESEEIAPAEAVSLANDANAQELAEIVVLDLEELKTFELTAKFTPDQAAQIKEMENNFEEKLGLIESKKNVPNQAAQINALEKGWDEILGDLKKKEIIKPTVLESIEIDFDTRKSEEYQNLIYRFVTLGDMFRNARVKPSAAGMFATFIDRLKNVPASETGLKRAAGQLYEDIVNERVRLPVREWEYEDRVAKKNADLKNMLLSDLSREQSETERHIDVISKRLEYLEQVEPLFRTGDGKIENLRKRHMIEILLKGNKEYLAAVNHEIELEKKGERKIELPTAKEIFDPYAKWGEFPEIEIETPEELQKAA